MNIVQAIILGFVQGITEFLPISSDGHLSLFNHLMGTSGGGQNSLLFTVLLHLGTLIAVLIVFWSDVCELFFGFFALLRDLFTGKLRWKTMPGPQKTVVMLLVTLIPAFFLLPIKDIFENLANDNDIMAEGICFVFNGILLLMAGTAKNGKRKADGMKLRDPVILGFFQALAALPGVSRSGSTISVGLLRGFSKDFVVKFSFLMSIPAILGANVIELKDAAAAKEAFYPAPFILGIAVAAVTGIFAIKAIQWLVKKDKFSLFGYYCLALGALTIIASIIEKTQGCNILHIFIR